MQIRKPTVAGQFYPEDRETCLAEIRQCLPAEVPGQGLPVPLVGGLVPHAGWTFSGALAALVFAAVKRQRGTVGTFVVCGAAHGYFGSEPVVDGSDAWETPLGTTQIDAALRQALLDSGAVIADSGAHRHEHSIEVQVPFIQHLFPDAQIVPIIVPTTKSALGLGQALADASLAHGGLEGGKSANPQSPVFIGSTDLTHYGPRYGFTPMGIGSEALHWASEVNDRQFIDLALSLEPRHLLANALENGNACGPGAAAAVVAAAKQLGAQKGVLLAHTNSNEIMLREMGTVSRDSVGYAAIVF
ncbi:MAG: AmmeMemoRadiSam system protein B [Planctomycetes bacterium]|nr:AmmeMemoRadiSam system protein B [Planctomycetota bacterium]